MEKETTPSGKYRKEQKQIEMHTAAIDTKLSTMSRSRLSKRNNRIPRKLRV